MQVKCILQEQVKDSDYNGNGDNLLINWYLKNPVNRQGQAEYRTEDGQVAYTIDRWLIGWDAYTKISTGGVNITSDFYQKLPSEVLAFIAGKEVTISLLTDKSLYSCTGIYDGADNIGSGGPVVLSPYYGGSPCFAIFGEPSNYETLIAAKLELGPAQTLAHQDADGNWILNDSPNYDLQYLLCSQYSPTTGEWTGLPYSNLNLLDNAYWANRESIINQREQEEYTGDMYSIDRWKVQRNSTISLQENYIHYSCAAKTSSGFWCIVEKSRIPRDANITFSILMRGVGTVQIGQLPAPVNNAVTLSEDWNVYAVTIPYSSILEYNASTFYFGIWNFSDIVEAEADIIAAKLELGPVQTLAHQDASGNWVLNDPPPNKALELAKCQRYQIVFEDWGRFRCTNVSQDHIDFFVPLPVTSRISLSATTITNLISSNQILIREYSNLNIQEGFTCGFVINTGSGLQIRLNKTAHGLTDALIEIAKNTIFDFNL